MPKVLLLLNLALLFPTFTVAGLPVPEQPYPEFRERFSGGKITRAKGHAPAPWAGRNPDPLSTGEIRYHADPITQSPAFSIVNLTGPTTQTLSIPVLELKPEQTYLLRCEILLMGNTKGSIVLSGAASHTVTVTQEAHVWKTVEKVFETRDWDISISFSHSGRGKANAMFIRNCSITAVVDPGTELANAQNIENPLYRTYKDVFSSCGSVRFLNTLEPDALLEQMQGANTFPTDHPEFQRSATLQVARTPRMPSDIGFRIENREPVFEGELVVALFSARGRKTPQTRDDGLDAEIHIVLRGKDGKLLNRSRGTRFFLRDHWTRVWAAMDTPAERMYAPGEFSIEIWCGTKRQSIDIGGGALLAIQNVDLARLPRRSWNYAGRSPTDPWRAHAEERIAKHRTAYLEVEVLDRQQKPLEGWKVSAELVNPAFLWGTQLSLAAFEQSPPLQSRLVDSFNAVRLRDVSPGDKMALLEKSKRARFHAFCENNHLSLQSAPLFRPAIQHLPPSLRKQTGLDLTEVIRKQISERIEASAGAVNQWIISAETAGNVDMLLREGLPFLAETYSFTQAALPGRELWMEEVDLLHATNQGSFSKFDIPPGKGWIGWLQQNGIQLTGLALHGSRGLVRYHPEQVWRLWDALVKRHKVQLMFTHLQVQVPDSQKLAQQQYQVDQFRDSLMLAYAHPHVRGVTLSGCWAGDHPVPSSALWDEEWRQTALGNVYADLVLRQWWTRENGKTNAKGLYGFQGHLGDYVLQLSGPDGQTIQRELTLRSGQTITVTVP